MSALFTRTNEGTMLSLLRGGKSWIVPSNSRPSPKKALPGTNDRLNTLAKPGCQSTSQRSRTNVVGINFMSGSLSRIDATTNPLEIVGNRTVRQVVFNRPKSTWIPWLRYRWLNSLSERSFQDDCGWNRIFLHLY